MIRWRRAVAEDAFALCDLERRANLVGLAHVFPAERYPFPDDQVLTRWVLVLSDPGVRVDVVDGQGAGVLDAVSAYDDSTLRHLAVSPEAWGAGVGRAGVERAVQAIRATGTRPRLWCLVDNHRARSLYERLGWTPTGEVKEAEWPPHPDEMEYAWQSGGDPDPEVES